MSRAVRLRDVLGLEHDLSRTLRHLHVERNRAGLLAAGGALLPHREQRLHAPFVSRATRFDALPQPGLLLRQLLVKLLVCRCVAGEPLFLLAKKRRVVAGPGREPSTIEFDDARRDVLQKGTVVCDKQDGAQVIG